MKTTILALGPHPEDVELGCGGTLVKYIERGADVYYANFTIAEKSTKPPFQPDAQKEEMILAAKELGIEPQKVLIKNWPVREFKHYRQEILDYLIQLRRDINPEIVFCHSRDDIHQDHSTIAEEAIRAFKYSTILGYELPWNNFKFHCDFFSEIGHRHLEKKKAAIACYKARSFRSYMDPDKIEAWKKMRGLQIEVEYAEVFEIIRWIDRL